MCHVYRARLSCCQCCIFFHEKNCYFFHFWCFSIVIRICLKNNLLSFVPLFHDIASGTNWILSVIFIISMLRNDSYNCHGIWPDCKWCIHMEFNSCVIHRHCFFQHGKIIDRTVIAAVIVCKCHVRCCQRFSVCKFNIVTDLNGPGKSVITYRIISCQIFPDRKICICNSKRTLDQRFMYVLSCAPSICRIKTRFRL